MKSRRSVFSESLKESNSDTTSFLSYTLFFAKGASSIVKQGISFALKNPLQTIAMGLAFQAAAVAATSSFNLQECMCSLIPDKSARTMRILTIDGGGVRDIVSATILDGIQEHLQKKLGKETNLTQCFELMSGASTSGIIITGLNAGISIEKLINLYIDHSTTIWGKQYLFLEWINSLVNIAMPKYSAVPLEEILKEYLKDKWLNESYSHILIPADSLDTQSSYLFNSCKAKELESENFKMRDVARSIFAIPTYFSAAEIKNAKGQEMTFVDGSIWANDPISEAIRFAEQKCPECDLYVLSLGTWQEPKNPKVEDLVNVGTWGWGKQSLNQMLARIQTLQDRKFRTTNGCSQTSYGRKLEYNRFQLSIPSIDLDDANSVPDLREAALCFLKENSEDRERLEQVVNELSELQKTNAYYKSGCKNENLKSTEAVSNNKDQSIEIEIQECQGVQEKKLEQEAVEARRAEEADQERTQKQEIEKREKQEKIALWGSGIDIMIQHVTVLQSVNWRLYGDNNPFLFDKLMKMFDPMKKYYKAEEQAKLCAEEYPTLDYGRLNENFPTDYATLLGHISDLMQSASERVEERSNLFIEWKHSLPRGFYDGGDSERRKQHELFRREQSEAMNLARNVNIFIKDLLKKKMENYVLYQGTFHPRWDVLVKLFGQP